MTVAVSYRKLAEAAVATLVAADSDVSQLVTAGNLVVVQARSYDATTKACSLVVEWTAETNADMGATGGGSYWRAQILLHVRQSVVKDRTRDLSDRALGAAERFLNGLSVSSLNTGLSGTNITVHGLTAGEAVNPDVIEDREQIAYTVGRTVHYAVS